MISFPFFWRRSHLFHMTSVFLISSTRNKTLRKASLKQTSGAARLKLSRSVVSEPSDTNTLLTALSSSSPNCQAPYPSFSQSETCPPPSSLLSFGFHRMRRLGCAMPSEVIRGGAASATKVPIKSMFNSDCWRPLTETVEAFHLQRDAWRLLANLSELTHSSRELSHLLHRAQALADTGKI